VSWIFVDPHSLWLKGNPRFEALARQVGLHTREQEER
jgi:hypothetical protein